jgi:NAD+ diphosphatase
MNASMVFPLRQFAFARGQLDRAAHLRDHADKLAALRARPDAGCYVMQREGMVLRKTDNGLNPMLPYALAKTLPVDSLEIFLGLRGETPLFALPLRRGAEENFNHAGLELSDLRPLATQGLLSHDDLSPLAEAKSLIGWHRRHGFCANCGTPSTPTSAGWRRDCAKCDIQHFPRTDPVAIMLVTDGDTCLLGRSARFASNMWSCLAGFVEPGESIEDAVRREVLEEAGIVCGEVSYFASQPWPYPSSLMIGCVARALTQEITIDPAELEGARWFTRAEAQAMLENRHAEGLTAPNPFAIAHHLLTDWVRNGDS